MYKILRKRVLTAATKEFVVEAPLVARSAKPGQFIIVRHGPVGERIPLTIADFDSAAGTVTIVFQEVGKTTKDLGLLEAGDSIDDFVGPLGVPAELPDRGPVVCIGAGVGAAPVYPKAKALHAAGVKVIGIVGARSADLLIMIDEMRAVCSELHVCTDDGSLGFKGFVSQLLDKLLNEGLKPEEVIVIGPIPAMRATIAVTKPRGIKTAVSMNPIMVDGTGMCGACRLTVGGKTRFCCVDGPMFDGFEVDFDEAWRRSRQYLSEEKAAMEHAAGCRCGGEAK
ncbi:MAG: sulfide/dihydroorotate dehydrogenase-like FAD/NAD-binding protein [Bacillota bacterium]|nr:sulfide/dihydroorotate dehydrogenase-like FAD/NAD-binding protein [Bacillota bacterium]